MPISKSIEAPLITVGITCYNAEDTIERAIRSAAGQDWPNTEILIIDDCSTDNSVVKINLAITNLPQARLIISERNGGAAAARNQLLKNCKGTFIAFFDDDDESHPKRIRVQLARLLRHERETGKTNICCYASGRRLYPNGYSLEIEAIGSRPKIPSGPRIADYLLFNGRVDGVFYGGGTPTCSLLARVETLEHVGGFDPTLRRVEDIDLAIRIALADGDFIGCPEDLYLQHATEASDKTPARNLESELQIVEKYAEYLKTRGSYIYSRDWFWIRYLHFSRQRVRFLLALVYFLLRFPLRGSRHLLRSAPARARHEARMAARPEGLKS